MARADLVLGGGSATLDESNYLNAAFSCWWHAIKANSIRWIRTATRQTAGPQLYVFTIPLAGGQGGDSIGLYFETADLRTAVARGRDSYYGWFCSNLWHFWGGHVTHIIQGFTLPLITPGEKRLGSAPYEANHFHGPATEQLGDNGNPVLLILPSVDPEEIDWLSFCDSLKAHNSDIIVYSLFLLDLLAGAQFIPARLSKSEG